MNKKGRPPIHILVPGAYQYLFSVPSDTDYIHLEYLLLPWVVMKSTSLEEINPSEMSLNYNIENLNGSI